MPNAGYAKGRRFEYERKKWWEALGYVVLRMAGSHGFADLVALDPTGAEPVQCIQCKVVRTDAEAKRLVKAFIQEPPLPTSIHFNQRIEVRVPRKGLWLGMAA